MSGEHPPGAPSREVLIQRTIAECYAKAETFLNGRRIAIDDAFIGAKKIPHSTSESTFQKDEILNDRAEVERLEAAFAHKAARSTPEGRKTYETNKQFSDIFEAMFADIAPQIFGDGVEVIVPSKFDDYKRQTDLVVVFKDAAGKPEGSIVVDFTTEKDVEGYDTPEGHHGGLEQKWGRSLSEIAAKDQGLHSVKYARVHGVGMSLNYNPRILVGLSIPEIARLAALWKAGTLDIRKEPRVWELSRSIRRQLIAQLSLAKNNNREKAKNRIVRVLSVAQKRVKEIPEDTQAPATSDPVLKAINSLLTIEQRQAQYEKAAAERQAYEAKLVPNTKAEWKKPLTEALTEGEAGERAKLEAHLKVVDPDGTVFKEVSALLAGKPHHFTKEMMPVIAGGVPTRLWRRLHEVVHAPTQQKEPEPKPAPHTEDPHGTETHSIRLDVAAHLAILKKASGITEEKYKQLDTRGKRIWSFIKEKGIRALVAGVGAAIGSTFALALCAGALPSMLVALGGAVAGSLLGSYLLKKYYYDKHPDKDHTKDRARAAVIQSLSRWAQNNPYSFAQYYSGPHGEVALKQAIERKVFLRNFAGNALAAGVGTVVGLEVRTGGQFTKTLLSGDFDALWKLFYCPPTQAAPRGAVRGIPPDGYAPQGRSAGAGVVGNRYSGAGVDGLQRTPQNSLGRGMYSKGAMYTFETPRARLPAWMHQQCIGRCNTTAPFGYHSWVPGRIGSSGQQLYQLKYTPR
jgi:hypothetical protein